MDWIKFILAAIGLIAIGVVLFWVVGIITTIIWLAIWIAVLAVAGYGVYKLFLEKDKETKKLEKAIPTGLTEMRKAERELEELKRKYLPK